VLRHAVRKTGWWIHFQLRATFLVPHALLSYTLAITEITLGEFIKGNWAVIFAALPFIYTGICLAIIKRDLHFRHLVQRKQEIEKDESATLDLLDLRKESEASFWQSWSTIKTPLQSPGQTTTTLIEYSVMAFAGICVLVGMKLALDYIKREIEKYEDEYNELVD
jgi:hypothetical protein